MPRISAVDVINVRFPTAGTRPGRAMTDTDGGRCAAYVVLRTDGESAGHSAAFTDGHSADLCAMAARRIAEPLLGRDVDDLAASLGPTYRQLTADDRLGREPPVAQLAAGVVLDALWDLVARRAGKPLWRFVSEMSPADLVAACDFRYLSDVLTEDEALEALERLAPSRPERTNHLARVGYPAYTSAANLLDHQDDMLRRLCGDAVAAGWHAVKVEVGGSAGRDKRRLAIARDELGPDGALLIDANQRWDVAEAIARITDLAQFGPLWIDEPTSADDIAGHAAIRAAVAPAGVAIGARCRSRVMVKQMLFAGAADYYQLEASRLASVNEIVPVLLMAAKFGAPVRYGADDVGLNGHAQHLAMIDFICVSGSMIGRLLEHVDVLHRHLSRPPVVDRAWYRLPLDPGYSARMHAESLATYRYPDGTHWRRASAR